jgi:hypothetical protein
MPEQESRTATRPPFARPETTRPEPGGDHMSRESVVQILGVVVAAATVLVTILAVAHLFSI